MPTTTCSFWAILLSCVLCGVSVGAIAAEPTGRALPGLETFDSEITSLMKRWDIPGSSLAVSRNGRVLLVRGYGMADRERNEPVQSTSRFRLGSLSKTVTAVAILKLVEEHRLSLDDKVLPLL